MRKYRKEAEEGGTPVFYLNAGDTYTGTAWFTVYKDKIASAFLNKLSPDAIVTIILLISAFSYYISSIYISIVSGQP